jgi:phospholipase C
VIEDGGLRVRISNGATTPGATAFAHFAIYSNDSADAAPRHYDVAPGQSIEAKFAMPEDGAYDMAVHGPAGFVRRFSGIADAARKDIGGRANRDDSANENAGSKPAFSRSGA